MMKTAIAFFVLAYSALGQGGAVKEASKPDAASAKVEKPATTPLTTEEKLTIRELQVEIQNLQRQRDVEIPKMINEVQDRINKIVETLVIKHNAQGVMLRNDLTWAPPQGGSSK